MAGRRRQLRGSELREVQQASYLLYRMTERQQAHYAVCAAEFNLSAAQAKVLMSLQPGEAVPMRGLAERVGSDPSNLTGLVDKLERRGALRRVPDPVDRRVKTLQLTDEGLRLREAFWHRLTHDAGPIAALTPCRWASCVSCCRPPLTHPNLIAESAWAMCRCSNSTSIRARGSVGVTELGACPRPERLMRGGQDSSCATGRRCRCVL